MAIAKKKRIYPMEGGRKREWKRGRRALPFEGPRSRLVGCFRPVVILAVDVPYSKKRSPSMDSWS